MRKLAEEQIRKIKDLNNKYLSEIVDKFKRKTWKVLQIKQRKVLLSHI